MSWSADTGFTGGDRQLNSQVRQRRQGEQDNGEDAGATTHERGVYSRDVHDATFA